MSAAVMAMRASPPRAERIRLFELVWRWAGPAAVAIGAVALMGLLAGLPALTVLVPGSVGMKANTAVGLLLLGLARILRVERPSARWSRAAALLLLGLVVAGSIVTLAEYLLGVDSGLDELIVRDLVPGIDPPGRPAPATAVGMLMLGVALMQRRDRRWSRNIADLGAALALAMASAAILGILYGAHAVVGGGALLRLAVPTALTIALLGLAVLLDGIDDGIAGLFARPTLGGLFARRFGLGVLVLLPMVGFIRRLGEEWGLYDPATGLVLMVISGAMVLSVYGVWAGRRLIHADEVAQAADARASWLISHFPKGAILAFDRDLRYTLAGGAALDVISPPGVALIGRTHAEVYPQSEWTSILRATLDGEEHEVEGWYGGTLFHTTINPLRDAAGAVIGGMIVGRDVTEDRRAELELQRLNTELGEYASLVSHDLASPLRRIQLFAGHVLDTDRRRLSPGSLDALERISTSSAYLQGLVADLLAYARLGREAMTTEAVDLGELVRSVAGDLQGELDECGASIDIGVLPTIEGDRSQLRSLFVNLLGNALKFRDDVRPLRISVMASRSSSDATDWSIAVADNGRGFDGAIAEQLFGLFQRPSSSRAIEGTGLGLAICRRVAERHFGTIVAEGTIGKGATFVLRLPARQPGSEGSSSG